MQGAGETQFLRLSYSYFFGALDRQEKANNLYKNELEKITFRNQLFWRRKCD